MKAFGDFRRLIPYLVLIVALVLGLLLAGTVQLRLGDIAKKVQTAVTDLVHSETGLTISYTRMGPGLLRSLELHGPVLRRDDGSIFARARSFKIVYNLFDLISARYLEAIGHFEVDGLELSIDTARDNKIISLLLQAPADTQVQQSVHDLAARAFASFSPGTRLAINDSRIVFLQDGLHLVVDIRRLDVYRGNDDLQVSTANLAAGLESSSFIGKKVSMQMGFNASYSPAGDVLFGRLFVDKAQYAGLSLKKQELSFSWFPSTINVQKSGEAAPVELAFEYDVAQQILDFHFQCRDYRLGSLFSFNVANIPELSMLASIPLTADVKASVDIKTGEIDYDGTLGASVVQQAIGTVNIACDFKGDSRTVNPVHITIRNPTSLVDFRGVVTLDAVKVQGLLSVNSTMISPQIPIEFSSPVSGTMKTGYQLNASRFTIGSTVFSECAILILGSQSILDLVCISPTGSGSMRLEAGISKAGAGRAGLSIVAYPLMAEGGLGNTFTPEFAILSGLSTASLLDCQLQLDSNETALSVMLHKFDLNDPVNKLVLSCQAGFNNNTLSVDKIRLSATGLQLDGTARLEKQIDRFIATSNLVINQEKLDLRASWKEDLSDIELSGTGGLYVKAELADGNLKGNFRMESLPVPLPGLPVRLSLLGNFNVPRNGTGWSVYVIDGSVFIKGLLPSYPDAYSRLSIAGTINQSGIALSTLRYLDPLGMLEGRADLVFDGEAGMDIQANLQSLGSKDEASTTAIEVKGGIRPTGLQLDFALLRSPLARFGVQGLDGRFSMTGSIAGQLDNPVVQAMASLQAATLSGAPLDAGLTLKYADGQLALREGFAAILKHRIDIAAIDYRIDSGELGFDLSYGQSSWKPGERIRMVSTIVLPGITADSGKKSMFSILNFPFSTEQRGNIVMTGVQNSQGWVWTEENSMVDLFIKKDGRFLLNTRGPFPVVCHADGSIVGTTIDLTISRMQMSIKPLSPLLDFGAYSIDDALVTGDLRVIGPLVDPSFFGTLRINDFTSTLDMCPLPVTSTLGFAVFEDKEISILPLIGNAGKIPVLFQGNFLLSRLDIVRFTLDIAIEDVKGVPMKAVFGPLKVDGYARGSVVLTGNGKDLAIQGNIEANDTVLSTTDVAAPAAAMEGNLIVGLDFVTGKNVEFLWPRSDFPILRSFVDRGQTVKLAYNSRSSDLRLNGKVSLRGGELFYLEKSFFIKEASLTLNEQGQTFDPFVNARAELRTFSGKEQYRLILKIQDNRLSALNPIVESDPPLSAQALSRLLSPGQNNTDGNLPVGDAIYLGTDIVSRFSVLRNIENQIRNFLQADVFSFRTGIVSNLLRDAVVQDTAPLDNDGYSFGKYLDNTSVLVGKFFGSDVYGEVLMQLRTEDAAKLDPVTLGLRLELELSMEWKTPFFDLRWSFSPKDPDVLYLTDHKFTFTWRIQ